MNHKLATLTIAGGFLASAVVLARAQDPAAARTEAMKRLREAKEKVAARRAADWESQLKAVKQRQHVLLANQLRPLYRFELFRLRIACDLSTEQIRAIRPEADAAFEKAVDGFSEAQLTPIPGPLQVRSPDLDYETIIRELVFSAAKRHVPAERWAAFQEEIARREASRKEAGVEFLVATLDRELQLTGRQRDQLMKSLSANWDSLWYAALELTLAGRPCVPRIPDELVVPHLSDTQRAIWGRMYKFEGPLWGVALDHGGEPDLEEALGARPMPDPPGAARARIVPGARQKRVRIVE